MEEGWSVVFSTSSDFHSQMICRMLEDHDIPAVVINKKDSNAFLIGDFELCVPTDQVIRAIQLIKEFEGE